MAYTKLASRATVSELLRYFRIVLGPEDRYYWLTLVYGIGISVLTLSTPISVQMLVNTVVNVGLTTPLVVLSLTLFGLLVLSGLLNALRIHLMDLFGRRFYARQVAQISLKALYARDPFFTDAGLSQLFNRYFDIIIVMKTLPNLLIGGFTIVLQSVVGFVLVSLYHPVFFVFIMVLIGVIWLIWAIWGRAAMFSAMELSHRKHATAAWLEDLGASNGLFKSEHQLRDALARTEHATARYMNQHERHFRNHFAQTLAFLMLYASASAALLGLGGWLVIQGQLTIGQLVAAELVLSVVFVGLSQLGIYLTYFYDLCGAIDELSLFEDVPVEDPDAWDGEEPSDGTLELSGAIGETRGVRARFDLTVPSGALVFARASSHAVQRLFTNFIKNHVDARSGLVTLGGIDVRQMNVHAVRRRIVVLDRPKIVEMTIREYLELAAEGRSSQAITEAIEVVGLAPVVAQLDDGLDTSLSTTGWPLSIPETLEMKLASAILARPKVLVLSQLFDVLPDRRLGDALAWLRREVGTTVIYFSNHESQVECESWLWLGADGQELTGDVEVFHGLLAEHHDTVTEGDR